MDRKLTTILAADVVGYSTLMERDEAGTHERLKAGRKELFEPEIARHHGRVFKLMGDGLLAEFGSVVNAVECAVSLQRGLVERNSHVPVDQRIQVRIGINLGEVIVEGDDRYGEGVNIAARLEQLADPGGICVSAKVAREVEKKLAFNFESMGEQKVKNIAEPVSCFRVGLQRSPPPRPDVTSAGPPDTLRKTSIAVLPFTNMSSDPEQEYFSDGISEDIITDLSKLSELHVIARNSSFVYKGRAVAVPDVAGQLGVRYVLEGSVRKAGNRVRVTAQLIDSVNGGHVWADRFDRDLSDIFAVQDELTQKIVAALKLKLTVKERDHLSHRREVNVEAYELFLRGLEHQRLTTRTGNQMARELLDRALKIDPGYAAAHARTALIHITDYLNGWSESPERSLQIGREIAEKAVEMDADEADGHFALGIACVAGRELDRALEAVERGLSLMPGSAEGHLAKARIQVFLGDAASAIATLENYMLLEPFYPSLALHFMAEARFSLGDYEAAALVLQERIARDPQSSTSQALLASCLGHLGRFDECRAAWAETLRLEPKFSLERQRRVLPYKNPSDFERRADGLRKAGVLVTGAK